MEAKINDISLMNLDEYIKITQNQQKYIMNYDPTNPPHAIIKNQINSILNTTNYVN